MGADSEIVVGHKLLRHLDFPKISAKNLLWLLIEPLLQRNEVHVGENVASNCIILGLSRVLHNLDVAFALGRKARVNPSAVSEFSALAIDCYYIYSLGSCLLGGQFHLVFKPLELVDGCYFYFNSSFVLVVPEIPNN